VRKIAQIYLQHIVDAQLPNGRFHNFKDKHGKFLDEEGSQDSFGRAVWSLGVTTTSNLVNRRVAENIMRKALPHVTQLSFPRSIAFALLGVKALSDDRLAHLLGRQLAIYFSKNSKEGWRWFEDCIRYSNGILPYALLMSEEATGQEVGLLSLRFLNTVSRVDGIPSPIGNKGWYCREGKRALYDQQCIDAADMVLANLAAYTKTGQKKYLQESYDWLGWFYGYNIKGVVMVTEEGGCYDGINERTINKKQGAESVLAYLLAYLALARHARLNRKNHS
jgi:hypothetical protein